MTTCLLIIGDGRDEYHERSVASAEQHLPIGLFDVCVVVDDREHKLGFAGAIQHGWDQALDAGADWIFHLEADFTFNQSVPLAQMIAALELHPELAQIALKRQPWNDNERAVGGIVEQHPDDYEEIAAGPLTLSVHRRCFTTNPCLYPARIARLGWPQEQHSEGVFTGRLLRDPHARFAFLGGKFDPPRVEHIGDTRAGNGY